MTFRRILVAISVFLLTIIRLNAQEKSSQVDSLVRLLSAQSMELIEKTELTIEKLPDLQGFCIMIPTLSATLLCGM